MTTMILSMKKKTKVDPWGLRGGHDAMTNGMLVYPETDKAVWARMQRFPMAAGEDFWNFSGGGGGYGHPLERDPEMVVEDVIDGYVSLEAARDIYGVIVADDGSWQPTDERRGHTTASEADAS